MAKLIKEIIIGKKTFKRYELKKENLISGSCPECIHPVTYFPERELFKCTNRECCFTANKDGVMIYSTEMRNKKIKEPLDVPDMKKFL